MHLLCAFQLKLGIFTESYGDHYGSQFADYLESQNAAIASGLIPGQNIPLVALGINTVGLTRQFKRRPTSISI